jgi:hypothetical protein
MIYLKTFESLDEYPFFEVTEAEYSSSITSDTTHVNLKMRDINDIMSIVVSKNRQFWYKEVGDGYAIHIINDIFKTRIMTMFKSDDDYYFIWVHHSHKFFKCDDIEGFKNFCNANPGTFASVP